MNRLRRPLILRPRLGIERVVLARPPIHPQQNHPLAALLHLLRSRQQHVPPGERDRPTRPAHTQRSQKPASRRNAFTVSRRRNKRSQHGRGLSVVLATHHINTKCVVARHYKIYRLKSSSSATSVSRS